MYCFILQLMCLCCVFVTVACVHVGIYAEVVDTDLKSAIRDLILSSLLFCLVHTIVRGSAVKDAGLV